MRCGIFYFGEHQVRIFPIHWIVIVWMIVTAPLVRADEESSFYRFRHPLLTLISKPLLVFSSPTILEQLASTYTTPEAIAAFLQKECLFMRDETLFGTADYWQAPEELALRRNGDCEDYALLASELLKRNGIEARIFCLFGKGGYAHTVSLFMDHEGRYNIINQDKVHYVHASSLELVASSIYPKWLFGGITERRGTRGRLIVPISKPPE